MIVPRPEEMRACNSCADGANVILCRVASSLALSWELSLAGTLWLKLWAYQRAQWRSDMLFHRRTILLFICGIQMMLATGALGADVQAKIEQLNQREKHLIEKLEDIRQRGRYIESQLEEVRRRKQVLLSQQGGNLPVKIPGATPAPTPAP
jgi:hypothetical protein